MRSRAAARRLSRGSRRDPRPAFVSARAWTPAPSEGPLRPPPVLLFVHTVYFTYVQRVECDWLADLQVAACKKNMQLTHDMYISPTSDNRQAIQSSACPVYFSLHLRSCSDEDKRLQYAGEICEPPPRQLARPFETKHNRTDAKKECDDSPAAERLQGDFGPPAQVPPLNPPLPAAPRPPGEGGEALCPPS